MSSVEEIRTAIERLPKKELARFRRWFMKYDAEIWDRKIEGDVTMPLPGWIVGPLVATAALVALGFVSLGFYASGGGLLIAAAVAFCSGAAVSAAVAPSRRGRNAAIVAAYVVLLMTAYLAAIQFRPLPPGASRGGANVPAPR